jgi:hypothetical protein
MGRHTDTTRPTDAGSRSVNRTTDPDPLRSDGTAPSLPHRPDPIHAYIADAWSDDPDRTTRRGDTSPYPYFV